MSNIAYNKPTFSNSFIKPYSPSRAVDGSTHPIRRWLSNTPCFLTVDLQRSYWINRWIVVHMGAVGWYGNYNNADFKLQGSQDNSNWFDIDTVSNNTSSHTDRQFKAVECRYVRVYVTRGLGINPQLASIVEFAVYEAPPTSPYLSNIVPSSGTLNPSFTKDNLDYSVDVEYQHDSITITPTAEDPEATIIVNGVAVQSGQPSQPINLNVGENTVEIEVTSLVGGLKKKYTVKVTRASSAFLENITGIPNLNFDKNTFDYTVNLNSHDSALKIVVTAEDSNASLTFNGDSISSGDAIKFKLNTGDNNITIVVNSNIGSSQKTYNIVIKNPS